MRLLRPGLVAATLAASAFGCAAPVGADPDAGTAQRLSVVDVRALHSATGTLNRVDASARFVSVHEPGAPADALALLGLAWPALRPGGCTTVAPATPEARSSVRVDLRDLSPVTLLVDGAPIGLEPRAFPDVAGLVSGVVFVAPADWPAPEGTRALGLQTAAGVLTGLELPELPAPLRMVGATAADGAWWVDAAGFEVVSVPPHGEDRTVLDLVRGGVVRARCAVDATGRVRVDAASLGGTGESTVVVRAQRHLVRDDLDARLERALELKLMVR